MRWALVVLCGCGRIGFALDTHDTPSDGGVEIDAPVVQPDQILIHTKPNSDVVVEGGARYKTDASGNLTIPAATPQSFHVITADKMNLMSALGVDPGATVSLGRSRTADVFTSTGGTNNEFFDVTPVDNVLFYDAVHGACGIASGGAGEMVPFAYVPDCLNAQLDVIVIATSSGTLAYADVGPVAIKPGSINVTQPWLSPSVYTFAIDNAAAVNSLTLDAELFRREKSTPFGDSLLGGTVGHTVENGNVTLSGSLAPLGDELLLRAELGETFSYLLFAPTALAPGNNSIDASAMLPPMTGLVTSTTTVAASWNAPPASNAQLVGFTGQVQFANGAYQYWTVWTDSATTSVAYPTLPADLAPASLATPMTYYNATVELVDALGLDRREAWALADRGFTDFRLQPIDVPAAGFAMSWLVIPPFD